MSPLTQQQVAQAERHFRSGQLQPAEALLRQVIDREPVARACELLAYIRGNQGQFEACEALLAKAVALPGSAPEVLFYLGRVQLQRGRAREAVDSFTHCIERAGEHFESLHELGVAYGALGDDEQALAAFQRAERKNPRSPEVQANMGDCLVALQHFAEALNRYDRALALDARQARAWSGRGDALARLQRRQEALDSYGRALALAPADSTSWMALATTLMLMAHYAEALAACEKVARLAPDTDYLHGTWLLASMYMGRWDGWAQRVEETVTRVDAGRKAAPPFSLVATPAGPATLLRSARTYAQDQFPPQPPVEFKPREPGRKLRVGYFSNDFRHHATSQLMARLFECHDRAGFEWFGFAIGQHAPDAMSARIAAGFDHFEQVGERHDAQIAARARELEIDIAIDLNGHTEGSRPNIFAHRAAPLQVNYLGFPGTMGCDYIDYIVADATLIPPDHYPHYTEKVVVLPGSYQVNDDTKRIGDDPGSRESHGLPPQGFVFASFNNLYKLTPPLFDVWMRILQKVPGSVLWLLEGNAGAQANLMNEVRARGVDPGRIVWAPRMELAGHLARHAHADLFLDSFYCNAHTTCSDALWAGLPLLTLAGETFASRVSASLLHAVGLPELVTSSTAEYEASALMLATSPAALADLRARLWAHRATMPLFDTVLFARRIETAYAAMWARHREDLAPDHLTVVDQVAG
jgi:predicted O-linked N-acetylglucosamine transferase (SPINDLY family)